MARYDFRSPRLYVEAPLEEGASVPLGPAQQHYLTHVLRLNAGGRVLAFNGRDGEWEASLETNKRAVDPIAGGVRNRAGRSDHLASGLPVSVSKVPWPVLVFFAVSSFGVPMASLRVGILGCGAGAQTTSLNFSVFS